ncbi:MAG TPA: EAL domain-containing protein [Verrucomicrobiae bacterium]|nr:EAL domain-containing protein [Verrucomicrobiae bacterium]
MTTQEPANMEAGDRMRAVIDSMMSFVGVLSLDGILLEINRAPLEAARLKREDIIGKPFAQSFYFAHSAKAQAQVDAALKRAASGESVREDVSVQVAGGHLRVFDGVFSSLRNAQGAIVQLVVSAVDVTARKRIEMSAQNSETLLRLIIDTQPDCLKVLSPEGVLQQMNPAGLAMLEADTLAQAQARPLIDFVAPEHRAAFADLHRQVMKGDSSSLVFEVIGLRGTRRWLETRAEPLRNPQRAVVGLLGLTRDVTAARAQQAHVERLSRTRRLSSGINALIVRTRSRGELFQEACRIAVEQGGFGLAWVGLRKRNGELGAVASNGQDGGHLAALRFPIDRDDPKACFPSVQAMRTGHIAICNDVAADPQAANWREPLLQLGYRSFVSQPLVVGGKVIGCFNLYAREAGFFDGDELALLDEMAKDLSYALEFILRDQALDTLAIYDPLTRLPNRKLLLERLQGYVETARGSGLRCALLMLDVERFKAINDAVGQAAGDELLKLIGERLKFHAGSSMNIARVAGDRFAVVIRDLDPAANVEDLVQAGGWDRLDPPFQHGEQDYAVTLKVGIALFPVDAADAESLVRSSELALKDGKTHGRRYTRYTREMSAVAQHKLGLDRQLRHALERDELVLYYQPKVDLRTGRVCGAEALLRWQSQERGLVMPNVIIPLMEETGLIREVGRWVLERALRQREDWRREGIDVPRIGVNVSAVQLREKHFVESVRALLAASPGAGSGLELEVTESMMIADPDANVAMLRSLRDLGVSVSIDDFGTGYSSLAYLTRLPLNAVKIDRSFIVAMAGSTESASVVSSIIALAHSLNLRVVAEGVDAEDQLRDLRLLRCDEIQGFLFAKPMPADEFAALVRSGRQLSGAPTL